MSDTLFYEELNEPFTVSLLTVEYYAKHLRQGMSEDEIITTLNDTLIKTCGVASPAKKDYDYLLDRLGCLNTKEDSPINRSSRVTFGSSFARWLSVADTINVLGLMTNYDKPRMRELYCHTDFQHVKELIKHYTQMLMETNKIRYEAALYGSGGRYSGDSSTDANVKTYDVNTKEGQAALRAAGVGTVSGSMLKGLGIDLGGSGDLPS